MGWVAGAAGAAARRRGRRRQPRPARRARAPRARDGLPRGRARAAGAAASVWALAARARLPGVRDTMMVRYSRSSCATGRRAAAPAAPPRCARASCRSCTASRPPAAGSAMRRRSASGTMGAALRDAHEGLRSLSPRERAGGARDRLRGPPVPGTPAAARRAVAWGLQTCLVFLRGIHAHVTVNSWQSRVPCVDVRKCTQRCALRVVLPAGRHGPPLCRPASGWGRTGLRRGAGRAWRPIRPWRRGSTRGQNAPAARAEREGKREGTKEGEDESL